MIEISPLYPQIVALAALIVAWFVRPKASKAKYRIDKVTFHDDTTKFYLMQRKLFGRWKLLQVQGPRAFNTYEEATKAMGDHLFIDRGYELSETVTVKEYGIF